MSSFRLLFIAGLALAPFAWAAPELGKPIDAKDLATWDISIPPTGEGLPTGALSYRRKPNQHCCSPPDPRSSRLNLKAAFGRLFSVRCFIRQYAVFISRSIAEAEGRMLPAPSRAFGRGFSGA